MCCLFIIKRELVFAKFEIGHLKLSKNVEHIVVDPLRVVTGLRSKMPLKMLMNR